MRVKHAPSAQAPTVDGSAILELKQTSPSHLYGKPRSLTAVLSAHALSPNELVMNIFVKITMSETFVGF